ncbi:hypothetical protein PR048_029008 [Dryococelus australis]|uniref:Integrase catalytic domain-containing protein n=1 Tax=Dryococelus australis TaxID=614101 RepID=A0ABQ9GES4_9NEOP|nr:hypothetical protein PR048_029008 [Dryococelus australis]
MGSIGSRQNGAETEAVSSDSRLFFSWFLEVVSLDKTYRVVIARMQNIFARHGIPEVFTKEYGFSYKTFSPRFPQSNGEAENGVDIAKHILPKSQYPNLGLLSYRCMPVESGLSPVEPLFGWKLRNTLPWLLSQLRSTWNDEAAIQDFKCKNLALKERNRKIHECG